MKQNPVACSWLLCGRIFCHRLPYWKGFTDVASRHLFKNESYLVALYRYFRKRFAPDFCIKKKRFIISIVTFFQQRAKASSSFTQLWILLTSQQSVCCVGVTVFQMLCILSFGNETSLNHTANVAWWALPITQRSFGDIFETPWSASLFLLRLLLDHLE